MSFRWNTLSGGLVAIFGAWVINEAVRMPGSSISTPGPGVVPAGIGLFLVLLGALALLNDLRRARNAQAVGGASSQLETAPASRDRPWTIPVWFAILTVAYCVGLQRVSFALATPVFLLLLGMVIDRQNQTTTYTRFARLLGRVGFPLLMTVLTYLLFSTILKLRLP